MEEAYPAKLERALRARGWDVSVSNQGVRGATARNAVCTVDRSISPLTKLTIVQFGGNLPMARLADEAERWLDKPVISINVATYWHALRSNGVNDKLYGFTSLFSKF